MERLDVVHKCEQERGRLAVAGVCGGGRVERGVPTLARVEERVPRQHALPVVAERREARARERPAGEDEAHDALAVQPAHHQLRQRGGVLAGRGGERRPAGGGVEREVGLARERVEELVVGRDRGGGDGEFGGCAPLAEVPARPAQGLAHLVLGIGERQVFDRRY